MDSKPIIGYLDRWSVRAGEAVTLYASSGSSASQAAARLTRIICGDPTRYGPGFDERSLPSSAAVGLPESVNLATQTLTPGSWATIDLGSARLPDLGTGSTITIGLDLMLTRIREPQTIFVLDLGDQTFDLISLAGGVLAAQIGADRALLRDRALEQRRWYRIELELADSRVQATISTRPSRSPGRDLFETVPSTTTVAFAERRPAKLRCWTLAGRDRSGDLDGRIGGLSLSVTPPPEAGHETRFTWDFSQGPDSRTLIETSEHRCHGTLHQLPTRAVTGARWDGTQQRWSDAPEQWDAVHFHKDDVYDAGWEPTATFRVAEDLPSGIYSVHLSNEEGEDRIPFFVRPAPGGPTNDVALLMSSATYLAYANHRMLIEGLDFIAARPRLRPEHEFVREHPELGRSMYEKHPDGSGMMFSSRLRPVLNLRPGADGWNFTPDTDLNAFLHRELGELDRPGHDVITDEDVHAEGLGALEPYRVLVTCTHPEYWSTRMLDALDAWQRQGGRLLYLGGNGFYWRVAFSDHWPGAMELRRAEDGVRNWQTGDGESYHAFTGEYGGMWRRLGRAPNELVGIGFAAQGFDRASSYVVNSASRTGRTEWIWQGVDDEDGRIGTSGLGGGAAGQEIDRYDTRLGSPGHAVVLASASEFSPDMVRTKEEFEGSVVYATPDPFVRSDIVFYETPSGGAVFSVGSISWFGALARNGYDNDIARMTANVLHRFADPTPFEPPRVEAFQTSQEPS